MTGFHDTDILILDGARTAFGRFQGGLKDMTPTELAIAASKGAIERAQVDAGQVESIVMGNVLPSASDTAYLPRHTGLALGVPEAADALLVGRACGSAMEAVIQAAKSIRLQEHNLVLAGGSENMSMTPYLLRGARDGYRMGHQQVEDWLMQSLYDQYAGCVIGQTVDALAKEYEVSRSQADEAALAGQQRTAHAQQQGWLAEEIVPITVTSRRREVVINQDECPRPALTAEQLTALPPLFGKDGIVTAGNSTGLTDGATALVVASGQWVNQEGKKPLGRVAGWGVAGVAPRSMGIGPVPATHKALAMAGLTIDDIDVVELNDSFAVQYLAVEKTLGLAPEKVNPNGGAIALGHPMGATGARLILSALYHLRRTGKRYGLCTLCIGGGQGMAVIVECLATA